MEDEYAYGSHFALRVLVLPILPLRKQEYKKQLALLRQHSRIALADIPPTTAGDAVTALIAPTPASRGFLNLNFVESWDPELLWLEEFQAHRRLMGVVGLLDCAEWTGEDGDGDLQDGAKAYRALLKSNASSGVFANRCYAFNPREDQNDNAEGLVVIPNVGDLDFYINTLLAELASNMLSGISKIMLGLESKMSVQIPVGQPSSSFRKVQQPTPTTPGSEHRSSLSVSTVQAFERANNPLSPFPLSRPASGLANPSQTVNTPENTNAKARKKHPGHIAKLKGDLFCLAGKPQEAINSYNEAVTIARATNDYAWQAAASEATIMTQVYQSWLATTPARDSMAIARPNFANLASMRAEAPVANSNNVALAKELPPRFFDALSLYARPASTRLNSATAPDSPGSTTPQTTAASADSESVIHPLLFVESCMRCIRMQLLLLFRQGIWDAETVGTLVEPPTTAWPAPSSSEIFRFSLSAPIKRPDIETTILLAYTQLSSPSMKRVDRVRFLEAISQIYYVLHMYRRRAIVVRELSVLLAVVPPESKAPHGHSAPTDIGTDREDAPVVRSRRQVVGADKILDLISQACTVYGLPAHKYKQTAEVHHKPQPSVLPSAALEAILQECFARFGWTELQYAMLKEAMRIAEIIPDYGGDIYFTVLALREVLEAISIGEQRHYIKSLHRLLDAAVKRDLDITLAYWGPEYLLRSISVLSLPDERIPQEQVLISPVNTDEDNRPPIFQAVRNLVRNKKAALVNPTLVEGEPADFLVTLENPFSVELEIENIELLCSGVDFEASATKICIPPLSVHTLTLTCIPRGAGTLEICGCRIRLNGCSERDFLIPSNSVARGEEALKKVGPRLLQHSRLKCSSYNQWSETKEMLTREYATADDYTFLACTVTPRLPLLELQSVSLVHGSLMLYEGESCTIQAKLVNSSSLAVNLLQHGFEDNVSSYQRQLLANDTLGMPFLYELERDIRQNPVLQVKPVEDGARILIKPNTSYAVAIECCGKRGLVEACVKLDYGFFPNIGPPSTSQKFFTRQISIPFAASVHPCLECQSWDVLLVPGMPTAVKQRHRRNLSITSIGRSLAIDEELEDNLRDLDTDVSCLLTLEVSNLSSRQAFEAVLKGSDWLGGKLKERIEPNTTVNLLFPIKKFCLTEEQIQRSVPSFTNKQFIVGKDIISAKELERFWYKEEILRNISLEWREVGTRRTGKCELRQLSLNDEMLSMIKLAELQLDIGVSCDGVTIPPDEKERWNAVAGDFLNLEMRVRNLKLRPLELVVWIAPTDNAVAAKGESDPLSRNIVIDGNSAAALPSLEAGSHADEPVMFSLSFTSKGLFSVKAVFEEAVHRPLHQIQVTFSRVRVERTLLFNVS